MMQHLLIPFLTTSALLVVASGFLVDELDKPQLLRELPFLETLSLNFKGYFEETTIPNLKIFDFLSAFCLLIQLNLLFPGWFFISNLLPSAFKFLLLSAVTVGLLVADSILISQWDYHALSFIWPLFLGQIAYELADQKTILPIEEQKKGEIEGKLGIQNVLSNPITLAPFGVLLTVISTIFIPNPLPFYMQKLFLLTVFTALLVFGKKFDFVLVEPWLLSFARFGLKPVLTNHAITELWKYHRGWNLELTWVEHLYMILFALTISIFWAHLEAASVTLSSEKPSKSNRLIVVCSFLYISMIFMHYQYACSIPNEELPLNLKEFGVFKKHLKKIYDQEVVAYKSKEFNLKMRNFGSLERNQSRGKFYFDANVEGIYQRTLPGKGKLRMLVLGDSIAQELVYGIQQMFSDKFALLFSFTMPCCRPYYSSFDTSNQQCRKFADEVVNMLKKNKFDVIFVAVGLSPKSSDKSDPKLIQDFYLSLENYAKDLLVMIGAPLDLPFDAFVENQKTLDHASNYNLQMSIALNLRESNQFHNISCQKCIKVAISDVFCNENDCELYDKSNRIPFYDNTENLSLFGSLKVGDVIRNRYDKFTKNSLKNYNFKERSNGTLNGMFKVRRI
ncbi:unnamed protein product [Bursaphelenchus xylophilus]|uniref:(pine wood nematode) hypothetical protein n=1 Tax=Bursaphelenchus xylophilus TaxID=6326 RepID=A0A1I7RKF8_BURXY|nr:unnamed protein product [Bursaphelenchus xylophilus]CAG9131348.1 unnamed protein product [Bursaphelenchus xylophilus]